LIASLVAFLQDDSTDADDDAYTTLSTEKIFNQRDIMVSSGEEVRRTFDNISQ
jgi:hypothetical protein